MTVGQQLEAGQYFDAQTSPALTPLVIDPVHPFPFLSNLSTSLACRLHDPDRAEPMYARIKVPSVLRQWIPLQADVAPGETLLVPLHEIIRGNVHTLYGGMELTATTLMRLTRDAEVEIDDDSDEALSEVVRGKSGSGVTSLWCERNRPGFAATRTSSPLAAKIPWMANFTLVRPTGCFAICPGVWKW